MQEVKEKVETASSVSADFNSQLEEFLRYINTLEAGQVVSGEVVQITNDSVFLDVGCKSEGRLPVTDFPEGLPKVGDKVTVLLEKVNGKDGPEISKKKADAKRLWKVVAEAFKKHGTIDGTITGTVKGGYNVSIGIDVTAFLPISQSDIQRVEDEKSLIGLKSKFYIERVYSPDKKLNIVVNRRKYLEEESKKAEDEFFSKFQIGDTVRGTVKSFTSFGAFIDLGGFDGLLHINDMSWGHVTRPKDFVKKGDVIDTKLIRVDTANRRINLSLKHFKEDPWVHFEDKYQVNQIVTGKVTKFTDFGAFVELEEGIEGLVHVSEFSWTKKTIKPQDILKLGQEVKVMILGYDIQAGRVSLGLKQATPNPWDKLDVNYPVGKKDSGVISKLMTNGAIVSFPDGIDAFLGAEDISWIKKVKHPGSVLKLNQKVDVVVLECDMEGHRVYVGMKQTEPNPWKAFAKEHKAGTVIEGEITSITSFGVFVKVDGGIEGLINTQNLSEDKGTTYEEACKKYKAGDKVKVYIVDVNVAKQKVAFSIRELKRKEMRDEISQYMAKEGKEDDGKYTMGDYIKDKKSR